MFMGEGGKSVFNFKDTVRSLSVVSNNPDYCIFKIKKNFLEQNKSHQHTLEVN